MENITKLVLKYINVSEQINNMYLEKKQLEKDIKSEYENIRDYCSTTGKTIDDYEE